MYIHTFIYNEYFDKNNTTKYINELLDSFFKYEIKFWDYEQIYKLVCEKYPRFKNYFEKLVLNKSRENICKYIVINEFGGIFISSLLLQNKSINLDYLIKEYILKHEKCKMHFFKGLQYDFTLDFLEIEKFLINTDVFVITNKSNSFMEYLLSNIDVNKIPLNEYQNILQLGNAFMSNQLCYFYNENFNVIFGQVYWFGGLKTIQNKNSKFEKEIFTVELWNNNDILLEKKNYNYLLDSIISELSNPEIFLNKWNWLYRVKKSIENMTMLIIFQYRNWIVIFCVVLLNICLNYLFSNFITSLIDVNLVSLDSISWNLDKPTIFKPKKFKFLKELTKNWKTIQLEVYNILELVNFSNQNMVIHGFDSSNIDDYILSNNGWIKYSNCFYYGLLTSDGKKFISNTDLCPETLKILDKFKKHINFCGFMLIPGGNILSGNILSGNILSNKDYLIESNSYDLYLDLIIPQPNNTSKIICNYGWNDYFIDEQVGKIIILKPSNLNYIVHYNQTNFNKIILYLNFNSE